jgi:hypothetical protein
MRMRWVGHGEDEICIPNLKEDTGVDGRRY